MVADIATTAGRCRRCGARYGWAGTGQAGTGARPGGPPYGSPRQPVGIGAVGIGAVGWFPGGANRGAPADRAPGTGVLRHVVQGRRRPHTPEPSDCRRLLDPDTASGRTWDITFTIGDFAR